MRDPINLNFNNNTNYPKLHYYVRLVRYIIYIRLVSHVILITAVRRDFQSIVRVYYVGARRQRHLHVQRTETAIVGV